MSNFRAIPFSKVDINNNSMDSSPPSSSSSVLTPPEEPIIAKRNIIINNANTINGIKIGGNDLLPLTPPDYTLFEKRSVTFDIPEDTSKIRNIKNNSNFIKPFAQDVDNFEMSINDDYEEEEEEEDLVESMNSIDISAKVLNNSDEILVSLLERDTEMKELFIINKDYFDGVNQFISDRSNSNNNNNNNNDVDCCDSWQEFLNILYSKREEISDKEWMKLIKNYLRENPPLLVKFEEIVGYFNFDDDNDDDSDVNANKNDDGDDDDDDDDEDDSYFDNNNQFYRDNYCYYQNNNFIDVTLVRDFPKMLENFESSYPQFFINLKQSFEKSNNNNNNNEEKSFYEEFKSILLKSRDEMSDAEWEESIYSILSPWPKLIDQFEEIISYEIGEE